MSDFILNKEDGIYRLAITMPYGSRINYDSEYHKSNYPLRVVETKSGKMIIACSANLMYQQLVLTNLDMLKKAPTIDYKFLANEYQPYIEKLLVDAPYCKEKDDFLIVIVVNGKSYEIYDSGYVKEDDLLVSSKGLSTMHVGLSSLYKVHDRLYFIKLFEAYSVSYNDSYFPFVYIDTKNYRPVLVRGK